MNHINIWTDGSCLTNPGPGGWAYLTNVNNQIIECSGYNLQTTNNRMELQAAIESLKSLTEGFKVTLFTDSQYVQKGITSWIYKWQKNSWKLSNGNPVINIDLWQELFDTARLHQINWEWVKAHHTNEMNNRVDLLARHAAKSQSNYRNII